MKKIIIISALVVIAIGFLFVKFAYNPSPAVQMDEKYNNLIGEWVRPDGGYILVVYSVDPKGKLYAEYLNPKSINIAKAKINKNNEIFIKFDDENYPGSTYTLEYDYELPFLKGKYYQAMLQKTYDVIFVKKGEM